MPRKIKVRYLKSHDYKVCLTTGIQGGLGSNGLISMNFFVDRPVIPDSEIVEIDDQGKRIGTSEVQLDGDVIREVQFGALFDVSTAKVLVNWLNSQIEKTK